MLRAALAIVDSLVPPSGRSDPAELQRGRLLVGLLLVLLIPMPVFVGNHVVAGRWVLAGISALTLGVELLVLVLHRLTGARHAVTHLLLAAGSISMVASALGSGGLLSPVTPVLMLVPLLAFVLVTARWGYVWTGLVSLMYIGLLVAAWMGWVAPVPPEVSSGSVPILLNVWMLTLFAVGAVVFLRRLEQVRHRESLRAQERAEEASRAKSAFLANMSHELRTPMNGVLGLVEALVAEGGLTPEQLETLGTVRSSGRSLVSLLDDLLDLSRVEAGRLELEHEPVSPERLARDVVALLSERAASRRVQLEVAVADEVGWGWGDPARLRQVLLNLVGNAVKFTEDGQVRIAVARRGERIRLSVEDSGIGISREAQERLFEPFVQADASTTRRFGGSGLGLSISRRLVEAMGGSITVDSEVGVGSRFTVDVPLPPAAPPEPGSPSTTGPRPREGLRVLVAEDNPVNQLVVRRLLEQLGAVVTVVSDGEAALEAVEDGHFDLVLMDIHMPRLDGLDAARALRARGSVIPIVALTASALPEDRRAAKEAGMEGFLAKPLDPEALAASLVRYVPPPGDSKQGPSA